MSKWIIFWLILIIMFVLISLPVYNRYFLHIIYRDPASNCLIDISPSPVYKIAIVRRAIDTIRINSPTYYKKLCNYVTAINSTKSCGSSAAACAYNETEIGLNRPNNSSINGIAATLVHEICHFNQGRTHTPQEQLNSGANEAECNTEQKKFFDSLKK